MLNKGASLNEQAFQIVNHKIDLKLTLQNAVESGSATVEMRMTVPNHTFAEMLANPVDEYSGDALYRKVIDDAVLDLKGLCFTAGTLIHTKDGLVTIENIKVGDCVLSQPEETGERVYKRVVKTVAFEDKPVWEVVYFPKVEWDREGRMPDEFLKRLVVTPNHPFWVLGKGWTRVDELELFDQLEFADGQIVLVNRAVPLYRSDTEGVGWAQMPIFPGEGLLVDLRNGASGEFVSTNFVDILDDVDTEDDPSSLFRTSVFNMEVEDCHTYYVGTQGVWVHNTDCAEG